MKIAFVTAFYEPTIGGVEKVVQEFAERLVKEGNEVHVYCSDSDKEKRIKEKETIINGVKVHRCYYWFKVSKFGYVWPAIIWKLYKEDFDLIHSHVFGHAHSFFAALICKFKKIPHVHTTHCPWTEEFRPFLAQLFVNLTYPLFGRLTLKWADKVIAITPWELKFLKKYINKDKIIIIPNGANEILFKKIKSNKFKQKLNIKGKLVLYFGRLNITKGPDKFVLAAKEILKERKDISFVMIGPDEGMKDTVKKLIGTEKRIKLLDAIRDKKLIAEMYQGSDVYVMPSYREGLPLTLFEAMSCGLPIVASPVNGIPYEMKNNVNGFFVNYGDIKGLKNKILKILDDKNLCDKFSENNKRKAKKYHWSIIYNKTKEVYKNLIKNRNYNTLTIFI